MECLETNQDPVSTSFNHPSIKINSNIRFNLDNQLVGSNHLSHIHPCIILSIFCLSTNKEGDEHLNKGRHKSSPVRHGASFLPHIVVVVQLKRFQHIYNIAKWTILLFLAETHPGPSLLKKLHREIHLKNVVKVDAAADTDFDDASVVTGHSVV